MNRFFISTLLSLAGSAALAEGTPVGLWKTFGDDGRTAQSLVRIVESQGRLSGRIEKLLDPARQHQRCDRCPGELQGQPLAGLEILSGLRPDTGDRTAWSDGVLVDPASGRSFRASVRATDGGQKLQMRGSLGPLSRTQTWERVE